MRPHFERLEATPEELEALVEQARPVLDDAGYQKLKAAVRTLSVVTAMLESRETTLQSLRNLLCQAQTEKTASVLKRAGIHTDKTPGRGDAATGRVQDEIQSLAAVQLMNGHHETIHVFVVDIQQLNSGLGQEARVISDYIAAGIFEKAGEVSSTNCIKGRDARNLRLVFDFR